MWQLEACVILLDISFFSIEAWFHLLGYVNFQNSHVWPAVNLHAVQETPLHDQKLGIWSVISWSWVFVPIFFENSVDSVCYCDMILYPFIGQLTEDKIAHVFFQQASATAHGSCIHGTSVWCIWGPILFKGHLAFEITQYYSCWFSSVGSNEKHSQQRQFSYTRWSEGSHH